MRSRARLNVRSEADRSAHAAGLEGGFLPGPSQPTEFALLLDSRQVAQLLGIGRTKAFELMARGELPVVRIGRCVRVSRAGLAVWIAERTAHCGTPERLRS